LVSSFDYKLLYVFSVVSGSDPVGSESRWLLWIRICIGNMDQDSDPGQSKCLPKREKFTDVKFKRALIF